MSSEVNNPSRYGKSMNNPSTQEGVGFSGEISLGQILLVLWKRKVLIAVCATTAAIMGATYALMTTPIYAAAVIVQPVADGSGSLSGLSSQLGGVAALAGINLGGDAAAKKEGYLAFLRSRTLGEMFIDRKDVAPHLFSESWDSRTSAWKPKKRRPVLGFISSVSARLSGEEPRPGLNRLGPSMWEVYERLDKDVRAIIESSQTDLVTIQFRFRDPRLAADWANSYVALGNEELRLRSVAEANRAIQYLNEQAEKTNIADLRSTIYRLVERQLEQVMLANTQQDFAFHVIDRAVVPERRSHPNRLLIVLVSSLGGLAVGALLAVLTARYRSA